MANPGCYPTATLLALAPLASAGRLLPNTDIIVDAKSGVSGAGKTPSERTHFSEVHGSMGAYGVFNHERGFANRGTFIIDKAGVVRYAEENPPGTARDQDAWRKALATL